MERMLFAKTVDKSLLKAGLTIPVRFCDELSSVLGLSLKRGEKAKVLIHIGDNVFSVTFTHVDMKAADRDVYQIRYLETSPICNALKSRYVSSEKAAQEKAYIEIWTLNKGLEFKCYPMNAPSVKEEFFNYLGDVDCLYGYQKSYKLIFYRSYFQEALYDTEILTDQLTKQFRQFYIDRKRAGLIVEKSDADSLLINPEKGSVADFYSLILRNPFAAISKKGFFSKNESSDGKQFFAIQPELYAELDDSDLERIRVLIQKKIELYYSDRENKDNTEKTITQSNTDMVETSCKDTGGSLNEALNKWVNEYESQKKCPLAGNELAAFIRNDLPQVIYGTDIVSEEKYKVVASAGAGAWAFISWLSIFDRRVTESAVEGVYIVYLLSKDTKRLYLTLNQGCTNIRKKNSKKDTIALMHERSESIRKRVHTSSFISDDNINLGENLNELGELYQKGTIFYKEYLSSHIPSEQELRADLQAMVELYAEYANPTTKSKTGNTRKESSGNKAWLLTWNPQNWNWDNYAAALEASRFNEKFEVTWSCSNTHVAPGDDMYLTILGSNGPRGIIAAGKAISKVFEVPHWDYRKAAQGQKTNSVKVLFEKILDFRTDSVLPIETLQELFPEQKWNPQGSGIEIKEEYVTALQNLWNHTIKKPGSKNFKEFYYILDNFTS